MNLRQPLPRSKGALDRLAAREWFKPFKQFKRFKPFKNIQACAAGINSVLSAVPRMRQAGGTW